LHDRRHTFGARVIGVADIRRVQEWMGHANVQTTIVGAAFAADRWPSASEFDESGQGRLI
jgi:integrase